MDLRNSLMKNKTDTTYYLSLSRDLIGM